MVHMRQRQTQILPRVVATRYSAAFFQLQSSKTPAPLEPHFATTLVLHGEVAVVSVGSTIGSEEPQRFKKNWGSNT